MGLPRRPSHEDFQPDAFRGALSYGGHPSPLADPDTLNTAKSLLLAGYCPAAVAAEIGYSRGCHFIAAFKQRTGQHPVEFQTEHNIRTSRRVRVGPKHYEKKIRDRSQDRPLPLFVPKKRKKKLQKHRRRSKVKVVHVPQHDVDLVRSAGT